VLKKRPYRAEIIPKSFCHRFFGEMIVAFRRKAIAFPPISQWLSGDISWAFWRYLDGFSAIFRREMGVSLVIKCATI